MPDKKQEIIKSTAAFVQKKLEGAEAGHDWWHIQQVWHLAQRIAKNEQHDSFIAELGALLHDISDSKFNGGNETHGPAVARNFLKIIGTPAATIDAVVHIIENVSYRNSFDTPDIPTNTDLAIVQDADRLDAMGAIGIARTFHYGGYKNREIYNPAIPPAQYHSKEDYGKSTAPSINHFYEKLLRLKEGMHTQTGKRMAEERHAFMLQFLDQFYNEWNL